LADEEPTVPPPPPSAGPQPPLVEPHRVSVGGGLAAATFLVMLFGSARAIGFALWLLTQFGHVSYRQVEIILPTLLILGVVALLGVLGSMVFLFNRAGMAYNSNLPLGLPDGTISAVIALLLIIIFSITSVYLYGSLSAAETQGTSSYDVSAKDLGKIPPDQLVSISNNGDNTFTVNTTVPLRASQDLAKQILSVVGTLLVAIVGFYFGQRSVIGQDGRTGARTSPERRREQE
jgi:hypothetical protein